jgi:YD repeat-containing protein
MKCAEVERASVGGREACGVRAGAAAVTAGLSRVRVTVLACAMVMAVAGIRGVPEVAAAAEADGGEAVLAEGRWHDNAFGLSLRPPLDAKPVEQTADGAIIKFIDPPGYTVSVFIRQSELRIHFNTLKQQTALEVSYGSTEANLIDDVEIQPGGRQGSLTYFRVRRGQADDWVFGQAIVRIDPYTYGIIQLDSTVTGFAQNRRVFEAMLDSIEFTPPQDLDRMREAWIRTGARWHGNVTRDMLRRAMVAEQWYRVLEDGKDVGYMRTRHSLASEFGLLGIRVEVMSRIVVGSDTFDTESFFWESDDGVAELWSVQTARRSLRQTAVPGAAPRAGPGAGTRQGGAGNVPVMAPELFEETGVRSNQLGQNVISVRRRVPGTEEEKQWARPPEGYISQVEVHLLPSLLPREQQDMGFYAYSSQDAELTLRTLQVFPSEDGGYVVRERAAPNRAEQVATYDARGRLVRRQMADGRVIVPATPQQMRTIWDIR